MLSTILIILFILWALGVSTGIGGGLINLLIVVALVVWIINLINNRR